MTGPGNHPNTSVGSRRVFVALWPDGQTARQLAARVDHAHAHWGGRPMRPDTLHLTLAFLGLQEPDRIALLCAMIRAWRPVGGEITLDQLGRFKGPRIVWIGPSALEIPWLQALHAELWSQLHSLGFASPDEVFRPHVSLLRRADGTGLLMRDKAQDPQAAIVWRPRRCVLVASMPGESGSYYQTLAECEVAQPITPL